MATDGTILPKECSFSPGHIFGRYRIENLLGRGACGEVYKAWDTEKKQHIALKIHLKGTEGLERFKREAEAGKVVRHSGVCWVLESGEIDGFHYLTMKAIPGKSLDKLLAEKKQFRIWDAVRLVWKIAIIMSKVHRNRLIHRDLKLANIMVNEEDEPVIVDFGVARGTEDDRERLTQAGDAVGTPQYMSPEQTRGDLVAINQPMCDIYGLGVILYELLTGKPPFTGKRSEKFCLEELYRQIQEDAPAKPSTRRTGIDGELDEMCLKALAKKPADRYASMDDFAYHLSQYIINAIPKKTDPAESSAKRLDAALFEKGAGASKNEPRRSRNHLWRRGADDFVEAATRRKSLILALKYLVAGMLVGWASAVLVYFCGLKRDEPSAPSPPPPIPSPPIPSPPIAEAPFDEAKAKELQTSWANYLGRKVVEEVVLGDGVKMEFVLIPPGKFLMGSPADEKDRYNDEEQHAVEITRAFYLGKYEVTQEQYEKIVGKNPSYFSADGEGKKDVKDLDTGRFPVENVSWEDAAAFCRKLSAGDGKRRYRLPSEAEWEYACRAGTTTPFHFGKTLNGDKANCNGKEPYGTDKEGRYLARTRPVRRSDAANANAFGLYDMHGNVWEWCEEYYGPYKGLEIKDPLRTEEADKSARVLRGGSWGLSASDCRAARRFGIVPSFRSHNFGFRVSFRLD